RKDERASGPGTGRSFRPHPLTALAQHRPGQLRPAPAPVRLCRSCAGCTSRTRRPRRPRLSSGRPQPHHRRPRSRHAGGRSRAQVGLADHRPPRGGVRPRSHGHSRQPARRAQPRLQPMDPRRGGAGAVARGCGGTAQRLRRRAAFQLAREPAPLHGHRGSPERRTRRYRHPAHYRAGQRGRTHPAERCRRRGGTDGAAGTGNRGSVGSPRRRESQPAVIGALPFNHRLAIVIFLTFTVGYFGGSLLLDWMGPTPTLLRFIWFLFWPFAVITAVAIAVSAAFWRPQGTGWAGIGERLAPLVSLTAAIAIAYGLSVELARAERKSFARAH